MLNKLRNDRQKCYDPKVPKGMALRYAQPSTVLDILQRNCSDVQSQPYNVKQI